MVLTCGHRSSEGNAVVCKDYTDKGRRALAYRYVCNHCYREYKQDQIVFYSDRDAERWLLNA
jgi:hypothetical protein